MFNAKKTKVQLVQWIRDFFESTDGDKSIIGISGGKDSSVVAALCVEALGKKNVVGVMMPNGYQADIADSEKLIKFLDIPYIKVDIKDAVNGLIDAVFLQSFDNKINGTVQGMQKRDQASINLPPRIRMATLYYIGQCLGPGSRVANTCNLSENYVGYSTRYGDDAGDFSPLGKLTSEEVVELGKELGLPIELVEKIPSDGLTGKSDEEVLGFTYKEINNIIRHPEYARQLINNPIDEMHEKNKFKLELIPTFEPTKEYL